MTRRSSQPGSAADDPPHESISGGPTVRSGIGRRAYLRAAATAAAAAAAGCVGGTTVPDAPPAPSPVSLSIKTMPADDDPYSVRIAQQLALTLRRLGIAVEVVPMRDDVLFRDLLVDHDFDLYVARHPGGSDPDYLTPLLGSRFAGGTGWQNPFGFGDPAVDELLVTQRTETGRRRREAVFALQRAIAEQQPFTVIALPNTLGAAHRDRVSRVTDRGLSTPIDYLTARPGDDTEQSVLTVTYRNRWVTRNLNPLTVEYRDQRNVTGLLYDPLVIESDGQAHPWLGETWEVSGDAEVTVTLREDLQWHDGRPITTEDVAFTYRFLENTSLEDDELTRPAPRFREQTSLVADVEPLDDRRVRLQLVTPNRELVVRALTLPVLPAHEWEPRARRTRGPELDRDVPTTEALVWNNTNPVGSGPLRFGRAVPDERLVLERFEEHFLHRDAVGGLPGGLSDGFAFDRLDVRVVPSDAAAISLIDAEQADVTGTSADAAVVSSIQESDALRVLENRSGSFYHIGYNTREEPMADQGFRRVVARLLDRTVLVRDVFLDRAVPATSPLATSGWLAPDLEFSGDDAVLPFLGTRGRLDVSRARDELRRAGYRYDADGRLLARHPR